MLFRLYVNINVFVGSICYVVIRSAYKFFIRMLGYPGR